MIKCTYPKIFYFKMCSSMELVKYIHNVQPSPLSSVRTFSSPQIKLLCPFSNQFPFFNVPSPWQPLNCFLSLWLYLFLIFHINGIIWYVFYCVWLFSLSLMFSRFIHVYSTSFLFMLHCMDMPQFLIHQLIDIWAVSIFWLLSVVLL